MKETAATSGCSTSWPAAVAPPSTTGTRRPAGRPENLGQGQPGGRRGAGRLEYGRVAVGEARGGLPQRDGDGEVPRREQRRDSDRDVPGHQQLVGSGGRDGLAVRQQRRLGVVPQDRHTPRDLAAGLGQRLADLTDNQAGDLGRPLLECARRIGQCLRPPGPGDVTPGRRRADRAGDGGPGLVRPGCLPFAQDVGGVVRIYASESHRAGPFSVPLRADMLGSSRTLPRGPLVPRRQASACSHSPRSPGSLSPGLR